MNCICKKTIPHLCNEGEIGTIQSVERFAKVRKTDGWSGERYWSTERMENLIEFNFKRNFDYEDVKRIHNKEILLKEYFEKV
jgi:hypothetical protein